MVVRLDERSASRGASLSAAFLDMGERTRYAFERSMRGSFDGNDHTIHGKQIR